MTACKPAITLLLALAASHVCAQSDTIVSPRTITNARMISVGATEILDTYLSQEKFRGTELRFISHTERDRDDSRWSRRIVHQGGIAWADNRSGDGGEIAGAYHFSYGVLHGWAFPVGNASLSIKAGAQIDATAGFIYNTRGSNNPAQARLSLNLSPSFSATYSTHISRCPIAIRYEASAPLAGIMFSPNYGQSYYEIFSRGNYDRNIVPTTFVATPSLRQMLTIDVPISRTTLRIGYLGDIEQASVNNLKQHIYTHAVLIGIVKSFKTIRLRP